MVKLATYKPEYAESLLKLAATAPTDDVLQKTISEANVYSPYSELIVCTDENGNALGVCKTTFTGTVENTVDYIYVQPDFRRDENGTLLIVTVMQRAVNRLITRLRALTPKENEIAAAFFNRLGFTAEKQTDNAIEFSKNLLYMYKTETKQ